MAIPDLFTDLLNLRTSPLHLLSSGYSTKMHVRSFDLWSDDCDFGVRCCRLGGWEEGIALQIEVGFLVSPSYTWGRLPSSRSLQCNEGSDGCVC